MKNVIKTKLSSLAILLPLLFISCNDISNNESEQNSVGKARVTLSCASQSRSTVMPTDMTSEDTVKVTLTAEKLGTDKKYAEYTFDNGETSLEWAATTDDDGFIKESALEIMQKDSVLLDFGTYNFALSIYTKDQTSEEEKLRLTQSGFLEKFEVSEKIKSLEFTTEYVKYGNLALTFKWPCDEDDKSKIGKIEAGLFTLESKGASAFEFENTSYDFEELTIGDTKISGEPTVKSALYSVNEIPNGTYYLKYRVYDVSGNTLLNTILDVVKIHGYKTEETIDIDPEDINSLQRNAGSNIAFENKRIYIDCEPEGTLYLNSGNIAVSASYYEVNSDGNREEIGIDTDDITAKLLYCGTELDGSFYQWINDGFVMLGTGEKLVTGGTYQIYVSVNTTIDSKEISESALFDITVEEKEYYYVDVSVDDYADTLANEMLNLEAPAIVVVTGNGQDKDDDVRGTLREISDAIQGDSSSGGYKNIVYPVELDMLKVTGVTKVCANELYALMFESVVLPQTVTSIEAKSFYPSYVDNTSTKLSTVTIPASVTSIEGQAFENCSALKKFIVAPENKNYYTNSSGTILFGKTTDGEEETISLVATAAVDFEEMDFSSNEFAGVTAIEGYAFKNAKSIGEIKNLDNITSFGDRAFMYAKMDKLTIASIPILDDGVYPFYSTEVKNLTIDCDITEENFDSFERFIAYLYTGSTYHSRYGISNIENLVFNGYAYIKDSSSSSEPRNSSDNAFVDTSMFESSSSTLKSVEFNKGAYVGKFQFVICKNLESVKFGTPPEGYESSIASEAFGGYYNYQNYLTELDLTGVSKLDYRAFYHCTALEEVTIPATVTGSLDGAYSRDVFEGCTKLKKFIVEEGCTAVSAGGDGKYLVKPDGKTVFDAVYADLGEIDFTGTGITTVGNIAFFNRSSLTSLNLGSIETINSQSFSDLKNLTSLNLGDSIRVIPANSFTNTAKSREEAITVTIPDSVIAVAGGAFQNSKINFVRNDGATGDWYTVDSSIWSALVADTKTIDEVEKTKVEAEEGSTLDAKLTSLLTGSTATYLYKSH